MTFFLFLSPVGREMAIVMMTTTMQDALLMVGIAVDLMWTQVIALIVNALDVEWSVGLGMATVMIPITWLSVLLMAVIVVETM